MTDNPVFCALDTQNPMRASQLAENLSPHIGGIKIGMEFFYAAGLAGYQSLAATGLPIFLDLKLHDIPNTVAAAVNAICPLQPAILNVHARNKAFNEDIRIEKIAQRTPGFSGADLANLLNEASILAARDKREVICADDINRATDRIITGLEGNCLTDSRSKRLVAYHEIGHAITGTMLEYHDPVEKVTLIPRGQARGLTWFTPMEDQGLISRGQLLARITGTLGGRAAEEIIFGNTEVTTGASNDIMQATSLARQMVTRYGMSNVGPMAFETQSNNQVFLDGTMAGGSSITNDTATRIDKEVKLIISYCHKQAAQILTENREALDQLSTLLIKQETIEGNEFREILSDYSPLPEKTGYVSYFEKNKV